MREREGERERREKRERERETTLTTPWSVRILHTFNFTDQLDTRRLGDLTRAPQE